MSETKRVDIPLKHNSQQDWSWCFDGRPRTAYEADLGPAWVAGPTLDSDTVSDAVIVGAGYLGLSTALTLAEAGMDVVVIERDQVGDGASGRNGGQLTPGLARWEAAETIAALGEDAARRIWNGVSHGSFLRVDELIQRYGIAAERRHGHLTMASHPGHLDCLVEGFDAMRELGYPPVRVIERDEVQQFVDSPGYFGGVLDPSAGHLNPLAFVRGLAFAARRLGVRIFENSAVVDIDADARRVRTAAATVTARRAVVLAAHAGMGDLSAEAGAKTMQLITYVAATDRLPATLVDTLLPQRYAVYDTQPMIDYYRLSDSDRLIFGGLGETTHLPPGDALHRLRERIETVFPQLLGVKIDCAWCGTFDLTINGAVHTSQSAAGLYLAHGWSGHGVAQSVWIGDVIGRAMLGDRADFDMLSSIEHRSIPFGKQLTPFVLPVYKQLLQLQARMSPDRLISF